MTLSARLREAGAPTSVLALALQTYCDGAYNLTRLTIPEFVCDPRFQLHGIGAALAPTDSSEVHVAFATDPGTLLAELRRVLGPRLDGATVVAHDAQLVAHVLAQRFDINSRFMLCTRFLGNAVYADGLPAGDLESVSGRFAVPGFVTRSVLPGVRELDVRQLELVRRAALGDARLVLDLARTLGPCVPGGAPELRAIDQTIRMFAKRGFRLDTPGAERLLAEVQALLGSASLVASEGSLTQAAARLRRLISVARATGGLVPSQLEFHGARTGRWTAAGGVNLHNLPTRVVGPASQIRGLLHPRDGHVFVIVDAAQIEARILAWFAGERTLLAAFTSDIDIYADFASKVFGQPVRKPTASDPVDLAGELTPLRDVGKTAVLGLGYRMGAKLFLEGVAATPSGARLVASGRLTPATAETIVWCYRSTYPAIPRLWDSLESALLAALRVGGAHGPYRRDGSDVVATLPSGRELRYRGLKVRSGVRIFTGEDQNGDAAPRQRAGTWVVTAYGGELHGGPLTENLVQAIARDLLAGAVLRLEALGLQVIHHVHDEIVLEVPAEEAQAALEVAKAELSRDPAWESERGPLPLKAAGGIFTHYGKP